MTTDTSEKGLESLIVADMTSSGWIAGRPIDYDREYAVDLAQLRTFLETTQKTAAASLDLAEDSPTRRKFLARLQGEITKRGVIDVLRKGVGHGAHHLEFFYETPPPATPKRRSATPTTVSASPASSATAATRRSFRSTSVCLQRPAGRHF